MKIGDVELTARLCRRAAHCIRGHEYFGRWPGILEADAAVFDAIARHLKCEAQPVGHRWKGTGADRHCEICGARSDTGGEGKP